MRPPLSHGPEGGAGSRDCACGVISSDEFQGRLPATLVVVFLFRLSVQRGVYGIPDLLRILPFLTALHPGPPTISVRIVGGRATTEGADPTDRAREWSDPLTPKSFCLGLRTVVSNVAS